MSEATFFSYTFLLVLIVAFAIVGIVIFDSRNASRLLDDMHEELKKEGRA